MGTDNTEFFKMIRRMLKAGGKRAGNADEYDLKDYASLGETVELNLKEAIKVQRDNGKSWTDIGNSLGMTKQAAHKRFK